MNQLSTALRLENERLEYIRRVQAEQQQGLVQPQYVHNDNTTLSEDFHMGVFSLVGGVAFTLFVIAQFGVGWGYKYMWITLALGVGIEILFFGLRMVFRRIGKAWRQRRS